MGSIIFFVLLALYFLVQSTLFTLYIAIGLMDPETLSQYISGFVTGLSLLVIILTFAMFLKSSGKPYKSTFYKKRVKTILIVLLIWSLLKLIRGVAVLAGFQIIKAIIGSLDEDDPNETTKLLINIIFSLMVLINDIAPVLLTLNGSISSCFRKNSAIQQEEEQ